MTNTSYKASAIRTITVERDAVTELLNRIDKNFASACELILNCNGRVVVTGMGKSGHIGTKIAATLASTGTPAMFVHPGEASHGDMGMITPNDVVVALSNSGNTAEVVTLLPLLKRMNTPLISMTGNAESVLARAANANLDVSVQKEACSLDLAPTASTTATLVMGDALAIALMEAKGFSAEDFAFSHPGGALGRKLLLKVEDVMHDGALIPMVHAETLLSDALMEMTSKGLGMTTIVDDNNHLLGMFTDGDLRRTLDLNIDIHRTVITEVMTSDCKTARREMMAAEALNIMDQGKISVLAVVDDSNKTVGAVHLHDLLNAGVA